MNFDAAVSFLFKVDSNIDKSPQKAIAALDALQSDSRDAHSFIDSALNEASVLLQSSKTATHLNILVIMTDGCHFILMLSI